MATRHFIQKLRVFLSERKNSKLSQFYLAARNTGELCRTIFRSGSNRALWILNYIESVQGGHESIKCKLPVDRSKYPLPWYTYPAIEYLQQLDFSNCDIFEYGSGNSSKFWSKRAKTLISVESDPVWYESGLLELSSNRRLLLRKDKAGYVDAIHLGGSCYDIIVIDGAYRHSCAVEAIKSIKDGGLIILDNSDWWPKTAKLLRDARLNQIDFIGAGPINSYAWCTSLFFQDKFSIPRRTDQETIQVEGGIVQKAEQDGQV